VVNLAKIKIVVVFGDEIFREGLARLMKREKNIECVGMEQDGKKAVRIIRKTQPDIVLICISKAVQSYLKLMAQIRKVCLNERTIMIFDQVDEQDMVSISETRPEGCLSKSITCDGLLSAIHMIHQGKNVFDLKVSQELMRLLNQKRRLRTNIKLPTGV
jgi:DNA-binding NarL/FixJ family response regulator